ncbi:MAG: DNA/RNA non-specific endonuclease [Alphaproteobacteria bacterium]|nr:DNA/RNA non-specific endonuclease [Alphaproteobacteria bacterium]
MNRLNEITEKRLELGKKAAARWAERSAEREASRRSTDRGDIRAGNSPEALTDFLARNHLRAGRVRTLGVVRASFAERIIGTNDLRDDPVTPEEMLAGQPVGRVVENLDTPNRLSGFGTGFMIAPGLLMTNHHVLETAGDARGCGIQFGYETLGPGATEGETFELDADTFFTADEALDYAVVAVRSRSLSQTDLAKWGHHKLVDQTGKVLKGHAVTIVQHPGGGTKKYARVNNEIVDILEDYLHYLADTEPGSSGSPAFNTEFEVVALHHSGVPAMDGDVVLNRDNKPWRRHQGDDAIQWIANEGVRISRILTHLANAAFDTPEKAALRDSITGTTTDILDIELLDPQDCVPIEPAGQEAAGLGTIVSSSGGLQTTAARGVGAGQPVINVAGDAHVYFAPVHQQASAGLHESKPMLATESTPAVLERKLKRDADYARRRGYDEDFLTGYSVPLPTVSGDRMDELIRDRYGNPLILDYHHFSLVMNQDWMLQMWSAVNVDYSPEVRYDLTRAELGRDEWIEDPRIPGSLQIDDPELYKPARKFDRGHVVRRDDNAWGRTQEEMEYANSDTFHWTNCTPQHEHFNRAIGPYKGIWGKLEQHITRQSRSVGNRLTIFSGPVLDENRAIPHDFGGGTFNVPYDYWKVIIVAERSRRRRTPKLKSYGFLLEQKSTIDRRGLERLRPEKRFEIGEFEEQHRSLAQITDLTGVVFPDIVHEADAKRGDDGHIILEGLEKLKL